MAYFLSGAPTSALPGTKAPRRHCQGVFTDNPTLRYLHKEGRCLTLDGMIRASTASEIAMTNGRACTTTATGTITIRATR